MDLKTCYEKTLITITSTFKHCSVVKEFASKCSDVAQIGFSSSSLTLAALAGEPRTFQLCAPPEAKLDEIQHLKNLKTSLEISISPDFQTSIGLIDLLIVDVPRNYSELIKCLNRYGIYVNKYIIIPGTFAFGDKGENGHFPGLMQGINEFLNINSSWKIIYNVIENNGLVVLANAEEPTLDSEKIYSMVTFEIPDIKWVERFIVGLANPTNDLSYTEIEQISNKQLEKLNRSLRYGVIIGVERNFTVIKINNKEVILGYLVYHVGYKNRPLGV